MFSSDVLNVKYLSVTDEAEKLRIANFVISTLNSVIGLPATLKGHKVRLFTKLKWETDHFFSYAYTYQSE